MNDKRFDLSGLSATRTTLLGIAALLAPVEPWAAAAVVIAAVILDAVREIRKPAPTVEPDPED